MITALVILALAVGYALGKLDAIWRLHKLWSNLTPEQRDVLKEHIRS